MAPATRLCLLLPLRPAVAVAAAGTGVTAGAAVRSSRRRITATTCAAARAIHSHPPQPAKVVPVYGTGPPPEPPQPSPELAAEEQAERQERLARRKRQAELLRHAGDVKVSRQNLNQDQDQPGAGTTTTKPRTLKRRFWKDVHVREVNGALEIHLDSRPLRHPTTKAVIRLPASKPDLAHALAIEWDGLTSAQQATKQHLIPLTSLTCRALDIAADPSLRGAIAATVLRYLDTDSLLCFSPPPEEGARDDDDGSASLRAAQERAYASTVRRLTARLWPGISIVPVVDGDSIFPRQQPPGTREVVQGWILALSPFELAGLERATLAGKSLLAAARLVAEWSEEGAGAREPRSPPAAAADQQQQPGEAPDERFGVEEAARAVSLEVDWQTQQWGEVDDTHDVDREDLRRQLGSVVLLVSGTGKGSSSSNTTTS
ncbi:uncharacterized protein P884DRAFT_296653 [Thermothelomyces heterothallicus CBS 202.75]|uniref:uncharacterized protein n=1 Tax=Thermothelomyces heterothallicus CBS 202.75 TaxID=1149848 RepID=UPI0037437B55